MQQLPLDFSATGNSHRESSPTIDSTGTQSWTQKSALAILGTPSGYHFEEHVTIGGTRYEFRISNKIREWAYQLDEENNHIKSIFFLLKTWEKTYKFEIGFDNYARSERDNSRYQDDTVLEYIMHLRIIYIHKLDNNEWGARFVNQDGMNIKHFDYFKYLFHAWNIHNAIMPTIKEAILDIHKKMSK